MEVLAKTKNLRLTPRKARLVADMVRNMEIEQAFNILQFSTQKSAPLIEKTLRSAVSNAVNNFELDEEKLYISKILIDGGPLIKRIKPRAKGRADRILKRTSHITVGVSEKKEG